MNADVKARWVTALRSGKYKQASQALHRVAGNEHTFCCLGVLCELAVRARVVRKELEPGGMAFQYNGEGAVLPMEVMQWAGLPDENPLVVSDYGRNRRLTGLNDIDRAPFTEIADLIDRSL